MVDNKGVKYDQGKRGWALLPFDAVAKIVDVLDYGAGKYAPRNWERGMDWDRVFSALIRHLTDWWEKVDKGRGPGRDSDTGFSDLWHAGCCILFLIAYELRNIGNDNRPQKEIKQND